MIDEELIIDELLDLGLSELNAQTVAGWLPSQLDEARAQAVSDAAVRLLGALMAGGLGRVRQRAIGLAYAIDRPDLAGYLTLADAAEGEGVSQTQVANWRKQMEGAVAPPTRNLL
jgi:hypothetical protein